MLHAAARTDSSLTEEHDLVVNDEYFDYLATRANRPAQADAKTVNLFRSVRGTIKHQ
jgi:hypothetical protein